MEILAILVSFLWGLASILQKIIYKTNISYATMTVLTGFFYFIPLVLFYLKKRKSINQDLSKLSLSSYLLIACTVITTSFIANLIYYHLIKQYSASLVTTLVSTAPLFTVILAYLILKEKLNLKSLIGIVVTITGIILISMGT